MLKLRTFVPVAVGSAALVLGIAACSGGDANGPGQGSTGNGKHTIVFDASTSDGAPMTVTYGVGADTSQDTNAGSPWTKTTSSSEAFNIETLVVQNAGAGTVSCKITVDGKVVKQNQSSGQFATVSCTAS